MAATAWSSDRRRRDGACVPRRRWALEPHRRDQGSCGRRRTGRPCGSSPRRRCSPRSATRHSSPSSTRTSRRTSRATSSWSTSTGRPSPRRLADGPLRRPRSQRSPSTSPRHCMSCTRGRRAPRHQTLERAAVELALPDRAFRAKLADFGIARLLDSTRVTVPGTVIGTAAYLAPEQVRGGSRPPQRHLLARSHAHRGASRAARVRAALGHEALIARLTVAPTIPAKSRVAGRRCSPRWRHPIPRVAPPRFRLRSRRRCAQKDATAEMCSPCWRIRRPPRRPSAGRPDLAALAGTPPTETAGAAWARFGAGGSFGFGSGPGCEAEPDRTRSSTAGRHGQPEPATRRRDRL